MSLLNVTSHNGAFVDSCLYAPRHRWSVVGQLRSALQWIQALCMRALLPPRTRRLRVSETVSLGDKRFVSIVEVDGVDFLIGGGVANVSLLTRLGPVATEESFGEAVAEAWKQEETA